MSGRDERPSLRAFRASVDRSSFGTPSARKVQRYTSADTVKKIVKRSEAYTKRRKSREG